MITLAKVFDYTVTEEELGEYTERDLAELFFAADRDRKELPIAEVVYWKCVFEINNRIEAGVTS